MRALPPMFFCVVVVAAMVVAFLVGATATERAPVLCDEDAQASAQHAYYANTVMICSGVTVVLQD